MRRPWLLAAALAAAAVAVAVVALVSDHSTAEAAPPGFPDNPAGRKPVIFDIGAMIYAADPIRASAVASVRDLGGNALRVPVLWNVAAPAKRPSNFDPANPRDSHYDWSAYDATLKTAKKDGLEILLMPTGPAPSWAAKPGTNGLEPDPREFGKFVSALAQRYNGRFDPDQSGPAPALPKVDIWTVWNEPNLSIFLQPQRQNGRPYSPLLYRMLYLAAQSAIHDQQPSVPILIGETAPTGGTNSTDPLTFARQTLCLNGDFEPLPHCPLPDQKVDAVGWSTHPYPLVGQAPFEPAMNPHFVTMSSLSTLEVTLDGAAHAGAIPSDFPVYITEFGVQSYPDPSSRPPTSGSPSTSPTRIRVSSPSPSTCLTTTVLRLFQARFTADSSRGCGSSPGARSRPTTRSASHSPSRGSATRSRSGASCSLIRTPRR
jgi:hypothetical protein